MSVVHAIPGVSSQCAFGCQSGRIGVFDSETSRLVYSSRQQKPVVAMAIDDDNVIYVADSQRVFRHDLRTNSDATIQFQTLSEISHIAVKGTSICAATKRSGISLADGRNLQRKITETQINSIPPNLVHFVDDSNLIACYEDAHVSSWNFLSEESNELEIPRMLKNRKLCPLGVSGFTRKGSRYVAVGYESGISVYENGVFQEHNTFEQRGRFGAMARAPCFGDDYMIAVVDDSTLLPCGISQGPASPMTLHGAEIRSVSANYFMVYAADRDDEGYIAAILPEAFGDEFF